MTFTEQITFLGIVLALGAAIVNWSYARTANRHAGEALTLAKAAEARADRLETIARERRDVQWSADWDGELEALVVRNIGSDTAHNVELVVDQASKHQRFLITANVVEPTRAIECDLAAAYETARQEWERAADSGYIGTPHMGIEARITWRSDSDIPGVYAFDDLDI